MKQVDDKKAKDLARELADLIFKKFKEEPSQEEFGLIIGSILILKDVFEGMITDRGGSVVSYKKEEIQ